MLNIDLSGRTAIVTASAKRGGRAIALTLSQAGVAVVINARSDAAAADSVVAEIRALGGRAEACVADVSDPAAVERLIDTAVSAFGGLDILVNNAAIRPAESFADMTLEKWRAVTSVILDGSFLCAHAAAPHLKRSGHGRIINIAGISSFLVFSGRPHVVAAKAGLIGLSRALAIELAPHVTVNCVAPGKIEDETDSAEATATRSKRLVANSIPLGRSGATKDVASIVAYLCSDGMSYITGQTLHVNGGAYLT